MPRLDLVLLLILAGYIFLITFKVTKYYHQRIERQRLIFNSLITAFFLLLFSLLFDNYILKSCCLIDTRNWIASLNPIKNFRGLNVSIFTFLISFPLAKLLNLVIPNRTSLTYVVERWGNQVEFLLWKSLNEKSDEKKLLMLTTKSNKVYVAYVNKISEPIGDNYVTLIPNFSGYRNKDTQEFIVTTKYFDVIDHYVDLGQADRIDDVLGVTIAVEDIVMISKFDNEVFQGFQPQLEEKKTRHTTKAINNKGQSDKAQNLSQTKNTTQRRKVI